MTRDEILVWGMEEVGCLLLRVALDRVDPCPGRAGLGLAGLAMYWPWLGWPCSGRAGPVLGLAGLVMLWPGWPYSGPGRAGHVLALARLATP
jgi:hypothetical protein